MTLPATLPATTASVRLRGKLSLLAGQSGESFWSHPRLREIFPEYLFLTHGVIRASAPLMLAARAEAVTLAGTDPVAAALVPYLARHIAEEHEHDDWLLDDMAALGIDRAEILKRIPPIAVAEAVGAQYYWLHHVHPVAVLGYIAVLEGDPPCGDQVESAIIRTGLPRAAFRTILSHAQLDIGHKAEFEAFLDSLPLTPQQEALVGVSAIHAAAGMRNIFGLLLHDPRNSL